MSRVLKRTLWKLSQFFGVIFGAFVYVVGSAYLGYLLFGKPEAGLFTFLGSGVLATIIKWTYDDAKREIERENEELLRKLQVEDIKKKCNIK